MTSITPLDFWALLISLVTLSATLIIAIVSQRMAATLNNSRQSYRLYRRLPTWLKQIAMFFGTIWIIVGTIFQRSQLSTIDYYSKLIIVVAALVCLHFDGLQSLPHESLRRMWIPTHILCFLYALFDLLRNFSSFTQLLVLVGFSVSTGLAGFNGFIVCSEDQFGEPSIEYSTDLRNYLSFSYMNSLLFQPVLQKGSLEYEDLPPLTDVDCSFMVSKQFEQVKARNPQFTLFKTLFAVMKREWITQGFFQFVASNAIFISPLALEKILIFIKYQGKAQYVDEGLLPVNVWLAVVLLFIGPCCKSIGDGQNYVRGRHIGIRVKAALICKMYQKSLSVDLSSTKESIGRLNNLISVDVSDIQGFVAYSHYLWSTPYEICISTTLLFLVIGKAALAGMAVMIGTICFGFIMGKRLGVLQDKILSRKDSRMSIMNEVLNSIRILKYYAWELNFYEKIEIARIMELTSLLLFSLTNTALYLIWRIAPVLVAISAFLTYTEYFGHCLSPSIGFTALTLFNLLRNPLGTFPDMINLCVKTKISLDRIEAYLNTKDVVGLPNKDVSSTQKSSSDCANHQNGFLSFKNVTQAWRNVADERNCDADIKNDPCAGCISKLSVLYSSLSSCITLSNSQGVYTLVDDSSRHESIDMELGNLGIDENNETNANKSFEDVRIVLDNINFDVHPRSLVVIVGATGSGKSSLLQGTILGEGVILSGFRTASGNVSYSSQSAWIQNATLRDNVLFGHSMNCERYAQVLYSCSLFPDLKLLPEGDQTEIGEKGVNLSGGQQQRVNLARAAYADSDIVILDDPLSAVDAHVGEHIFRNLILNFLKDRTRILVTHNISILPYADQIICFDGVTNSIAANGSKKEVVEQLRIRLKSKGGGENEESANLFKRIINVLVEQEYQCPQNVESQSNTFHQDEMSTLMDKKKQKEAGNGIVSIETKKNGDVPLSVYWYYLCACGGVVATVSLIITSLWISYSWLFQNYCLGLWMEDMEINGNNMGLPLRRYIFSVASVVVSYLFRVVAQMICSFRASQKLHDKLVQSVLLAPCSWFDATPIGRIINRFSQDISTVDSSLMNSLLDFTDCALGTLQIISVISWFLPSLIIVLFPVLCFAMWIAKQYIVLSRELKRLENIKKSPVFVLFSETLNGLATIRAFRQESRFFKTCCTHVDAMNKCHIYLWIANRWLNFRFELCGALVTLIVGSGVVYTVEHGAGTLSASAAGLSLMYSLTFCDTLTWIGRTHAQCQMDLNSVERIEEYSTIEPEKYGLFNRKSHPWISYLLLGRSCLNYCKPVRIVDCEEFLRKSKLDGEKKQDLHVWPNAGTIVFDGVSLQYKSSMQPVLRNISFRIEGGTKVGVVGRTGAGKSSLIAALFRIVEPTGQIFIDGINVLELPLHDLRKKIAIVPQDPTLFRGSLRFNLDPFQEYSDDDIWIALKNVQMGDYVIALINEISATSQSRPEVLSPFDMIQVAEKGGNFSVGQRQLLCMARAILKNCKLLVLDECTASVDHETDSLIQDIVRSKLSHTTVICIAHRLQTVAFYDKILVMEKGSAAEFDVPYKLMTRDDSIFRSMCVSSGSFENLFVVAKTSFEQRQTHSPQS